MASIDFEHLQQRLQSFAEDREWDALLTPRNLAMAMAAEVGELLAEMQWLSDAEIAEAVTSRTELARSIEGEVADVLIYLTQLASVMSIDLPSAVDDKIRRNALKYPVAGAHDSG